MLILLGVIFIILTLFLFCSLKVASNCDKIIEQEKIRENKN